MLPDYRPMLAVPASRAFSADGWLFEPKWDGIRALLAHDGATAVLRGRRGTDITPRYPELTGFTADTPVVLDGEIVAFDDAGLPSFESLQRRMHLDNAAAIERAAAGTPIAFIAFDLLHHGRPMVDEPLSERRRHLEALAAPAAVVVSESVEEDGEAMWEAVVARGLEGIVAKRLTSPYRPGVRSPDWRKITNVSITTAVVGGFTPGEGGRGSTFGALLLGQWDGGALRYVGSVGTGFGDRDLTEIRAALDLASAPLSPFHDDGSLPEGAAWVHPALVASVGYRNWTSAGRLRHPRFRGFTDDAVEAVTVEREGPGT